MYMVSNEALSMVRRWMETVNLLIAVNKTEAVYVGGGRKVYGRKVQATVATSVILYAVL